MQYFHNYSQKSTDDHKSDVSQIIKMEPKEIRMG